MDSPYRSGLRRAYSHEPLSRKQGNAGLSVRSWPIPIHPELAAALGRYWPAGPLVTSTRYPSQPLTAHTISTDLSALQS